MLTGYAGGALRLGAAISLAVQDPKTSAYAAGVGAATALLLTPLTVGVLRFCCWLNSSKARPTIKAVAYSALMVGGVVLLYHLTGVLLGDFGLLDFRIIADEVSFPVLMLLSAFVLSRYIGTQKPPTS